MAKAISKGKKLPPWLVKDEEEMPPKKKGKPAKKKAKK